MSFSGYEGRAERFVTIWNLLAWTLASRHCIETKGMGWLVAEMVGEEGRTRRECAKHAKLAKPVDGCGYYAASVIKRLLMNYRSRSWIYISIHGNLEYNQEGSFEDLLSRRKSEMCISLATASRIRSTMSPPVSEIPNSRFSSRPNANMHKDEAPRHNIRPSIPSNPPLNLPSNSELSSPSSAPNSPKSTSDPTSPTRTFQSHPTCFSPPSLNLISPAATIPIAKPTIPTSASSNAHDTPHPPSFCAENRRYTVTALAVMDKSEKEVRHRQTGATSGLCHRHRFTMTWNSIRFVIASPRTSFDRGIQSVAPLSKLPALAREINIGSCSLIDLE
ncbi:hypothetical protein BJ508DRAFT_340470 [Ascobolus immersus RN42]|uniref:Uncharacterized protein n=1 Tax=Ascobolus immersus RN42 TaxID=1160509 RepID=A0A3N4HLY9_ASCIM|nr:hypothetical protein BJ508DRAFT_340470 [Ascobolus immersus RN42]